MKEKLQLDLFWIKIIGSVGSVLMTLAWSGIIQNALLSFVLGFLGASSILLFGFAANEAFKLARSLNRYMIRLLILSAVCSFPYFILYRDLLTTFRFSNFLSGPFTVFYGIGCIYVYEKLRVKWMKRSSAVALILFSVFLGVEYAPFCLIYLYIIHCYSEYEQMKYRDFNIILFSAAVLAICLSLYFFVPAELKPELLKAASMSGTGLGLFFIRNYSGEYQKADSRLAVFFGKYFFYFFYPSVIIIFAVVKFFLVTGG